MYQFRKPTDEFYRTSLFNDLVTACSDFESRAISLGEIARRLTRIAFELEIENEPDFLLIRGIESETDKFPLGVHREVWSPDVLQRFDAEREEIEAHYLSEAVPAIQRIRQVFG